MSKNEKIKEQIGWLKVVFGILSALLISLSGWLATNYKTTDEITASITTFLIVLSAFAIIVVNKKALNKIDELEDL